MNLLPKPLRKEVFNYTSDKSIHALKEDTQELISTSKTLIGRLYSDKFHLYAAYPVVIFFPFTSFRTFLFPHLTGEIYIDQKTTRIKLSLNPGLWNVIGVFLSIILIPIYFTTSSKNELALDPLFNFWVCIFPALVFLHILIVKKWLLNKVVLSLQLIQKE